MTRSTQARLAQVEECLITAFYAAVAIASTAFGVMLLATTEHVETWLALAWLSMLAAVACLIGRLLVGLADASVSAWVDTPR